MGFVKRPAHTLEVNPFFSLLTYRAFRPHPQDIEEPLSARFRKRKLGGSNRLLVLSVGKFHWRASVATFDENGEPSFGEPSESPNVTNMDGLVEWLCSFSANHKLRYVAVGIGWGFVVSALSGVPRHTDTETQRWLRVEPTRLLGESASNEGTSTNALVFHPHVENSCLRFKFQAEELTKIREVCAEAGLAIVRMVCEQAQMLEMAYAKEFDPSEIKAVMLTLPSSFLFLPLESNGWHAVHYDPAIDDGAVGSLLDYAKDALPPGGAFVYIDAGMPGMEDVVSSLRNHKPQALMDASQLVSFSAITLN